MKAWIAFKEYELKLTLSACKRFYDETGKDLQTVLMKYLEASALTSGSDTLTVTRTLFEVETFNIASYAIYCMAKEAESSSSLDDIQDGMYRVSWLPVIDKDSKKREPWPVVMLDIALQLNDYMTKYFDIKKKDS